MKRKSLLVCLGIAALSVQTSFAQLQTGPSSSQSPYVTPTIPGARAVSLVTVGDNINGYRMVGLPDGLGAYDNGDGTFTVLMNHEAGATDGITRAHGSTGAFVSKWVISKSGLSVVSGADLIQNVKIWNSASSGYTTFNASNPSTQARFARFCSADLPAVTAFYNPATGLGTQSRILMNGEESGAEGRGFAHIATGAEAGTSYQLPHLGKYSYENAVANPATGDKTVVVGLDDASPGQVYFYIGTKTNTGNEIEKAGLTNGQLYGVAVSGIILESNATYPAPNTAFSLVNIPNANNLTGAQLETASNTLGITRFLRPEDGAWDPRHPEDFYFVTTNGFTAPSRLYKLHFNDIDNLTLGGTITAVLDGTEGQKMLDNVGFDNYGHLIMQEDVGGQAHLGKTWQYHVDTDVLVEIASHDPSRFLNGAVNFLTQDEEASGTIDAEYLIGAGWSVIVDQAHYGISGELIQGGQLLAFFNPASYQAACAAFNPEITVSPSHTVSGQLGNTIYLGYGPQSVSLAGSSAKNFPGLNYNWTPVNTTNNPVTVSPAQTTTYTLEISHPDGCTKTVSKTINVVDIRDGNKDKVFICKSGKTLSVSVNAVPAQLQTGANLGDCSDMQARATNPQPAREIVLYPNPTSNTATVSLNLSENEVVGIRVFDMQGKEVMPAIRNQYKAGSHQVLLNTSGLGNGVYFVKVAAGSETTEIKMVVMH